MGMRDRRATSLYLRTPLPDESVSQITGNATREVKEVALKWLALFRGRGDGFAGSVAGRIKVTEVSINKKAEEPEKAEGRVVCELDVTEDMLNFGRTMHGGCAVFLIDECPTLPLSALSLAQGGTSDGGVSKSIDTVFHAPAHLGTKLRIVGTSITLGKRIMSTRCEIWDVNNHRLVASGVQLKMLPSPPKQKL